MIQIKKMGNAWQNRWAAKFFRVIDDEWLRRKANSGTRQSCARNSSGMFLPTLTRSSTVSLGLFESYYPDIREMRLFSDMSNEPFMTLTHAAYVPNFPPRRASN